MILMLGQPRTQNIWNTSNGNDQSTVEDLPDLGQPKIQNVWNSNNTNNQSTVSDLPAAFVVQEVKTPLRSIIASEQQQNRNYITVRSKPLKVTQVRLHWSLLKSI